MPKILIVGKFIFLLFSSDVAETRRHIHVEMRKNRRRRVAKFWLEPHIELVEPGNLNEREIQMAISLIEENQRLIDEQLDRFYSGRVLKVLRK